VRITKSRDFDQLAEERRWLRGEIPGSFLAPRRNWRPPLEWTAFAERVEQVLARPELRNVLRVLEEHNRNRSKRANAFLLGPQLFRIIHSIEARQDNLQWMPALDRSPAELRTHFRDASAKAKSMARLVRRGPRPFIALAARDDVTEASSLFLPCPTIQSPNELEAIVPLDRLLDDVAVSFDQVARKISGTRQHRNPAKKARDAERSELRRLAARDLAATFRQNLNQPCHSHVATILAVLTDIDTDADYVKKVEKRERRAAAIRGQKS
jgi:hypothetical protein